MGYGMCDMCDMCEQCRDYEHENTELKNELLSLKEREEELTSLLKEACILGSHIYDDDINTRKAVFEFIKYINNPQIKKILKEDKQ